MAWTSVLILLTAVSGSMGQFPVCPTFAADRDVCASQYISGLTTVSAPFSDVFQVYISSTIFEDISTVCSMYIDSQQGLILEKFLVLRQPNIVAVKQFYSCIVIAAEDCISSIDSRYLEALPTDQQFQDALTSVCNNVASIDFQCAASLNETLAICIALSQTAPEDFSTPEGLRNFICSVAQATETCVRVIYQACDVATAQHLSEYLDLLIPTACPLLDENSSVTTHSNPMAAVIVVMMISFINNLF